MIEDVKIKIKNIKLTKVRRINTIKIWPNKQKRGMGQK